MMRCTHWCTGFLLVSLLLPALNSKAATVRIFNPVSATELENTARVWAKPISGTYIDLGYVARGTYIEYTDSNAFNDELTETHTFHFAYDPTANDWWEAEGFVTVTVATWTAASFNQQLTPYVFLMPTIKDLDWYGTVRYWNKDTITKKIQKPDGVVAEIPAGENEEFVFELSRERVWSAPFWADGNGVWKPSNTATGMYSHTFWSVFSTATSYVQMKWEADGNEWANPTFCKTVVHVLDDNLNLLLTDQWGPCADTNEEPPEPGGGGGGGGGGENNETNGTDPGGGLTPEQIQTLINLVTESNVALNLLVECCEEGHVKLEELKTANTEGFNLVVDALASNHVDGQVVVGEIEAKIDGVVADNNAQAVAQGDDLEVGADGVVGNLGILANMVVNPIVEPAPAAMLFQWDNLGVGPDQVSIDYRNIPGGTLIANWAFNIILMFFIGAWVWAVWKYYEWSVTEMWKTPQATTSGESAAGFNANWATALIIAGVIVGIIGAFWFFAVVMTDTVPCVNEITAIFGDINAPAAPEGAALGVVIWTAGEFIPITCGLTLLSSYIFLRMTTTVQMQVWRAAMKFAVT